MITHYLTYRGVQIDLLRLDQIRPHGNKYYKLKYNLEAAHAAGASSLLTYGGAYSNHIAAMAQIGQQEGFHTIGFIRGEELEGKPEKWSATLREAAAHGMQLHFLSRSDYKKRHNPDFIREVQSKYPSAYLLPEGGTNELAVRGAEEILQGIDTSSYAHIALPMGTGGTVAGVLRSRPAQSVLAMATLQGDWLRDEVARWAPVDHLTLVQGHKQGGYGSVNDELVRMMNALFTGQFPENLPSGEPLVDDAFAKAESKMKLKEKLKLKSDGTKKLDEGFNSSDGRLYSDSFDKSEVQVTAGVLLDPIYTSRMVQMLLIMIERGRLRAGCRIFAIHTGGLQGITGANERLARSNCPLILTS